MLQINPRAYAIPENPERCPVEAYKLYASLRPPAYSGPDDPFYVAVRCQYPKTPMQWYKVQPVGINKISHFTTSMVKAAGICDSRKLTNTSYRKHLASRLNDGYVPKEVGRHVTGHKQASSLDNYAPISRRQQRVLSDIVSGKNINFNIPPMHPDVTLPICPTTPICPAPLVRRPDDVAPLVRRDVVPPPVRPDDVAPPVRPDDVAPPVRPDDAAPLVRRDVVPPPVRPYVAAPPVRPDVAPDTRLDLAVTDALPNFLQGALIHGPVHVSVTINQERPKSPPAKRRRINVIYDSDSE